MNPLLLVLGLGALGGGAYLVLKKDAPATPAPKEQPGLLPGLPSVLPGVLPSGLVFVQDALSVHLRQGQYYRGRMLLSGVSLPPFSISASEEEIGRGLSAVGFKDVRVYMTPADLPRDWPKETAQNVLPGTRWFQGQWSGLTADVPKPWVIEQVWVTASPALVAQRLSQAVAVSGLGSVMSG